MTYTHTRDEVAKVLESGVFPADYRDLTYAQLLKEGPLRSFLGNAPTGAKLILSYAGSKCKPTSLPEVVAVVGVDGKTQRSLDSDRILYSTCWFDTIVIDSSRDSK